MAARKPRIPRQQYVARFETEMALQQQRYCERLELWRHCPVAPCHRHRRCSSDVPFCMVWAHNNVPGEALMSAHEAISAATPTNIGAPERAARLLNPYDIFMWNTSADAFAQYLRNQNLRPKPQSPGSSVAANDRAKRKIVLRFGFFVQVNAELLYTPIADAVRRSLPRSGIAITLGTAVRWDGGLYLHTNLKARLRYTCTKVAPGQIVYCADPSTFAIPFGPRPMPRDQERGGWTALATSGRDCTAT